jgi:hypothetical protein
VAGFGAPARFVEVGVLELLNGLLLCQGMVHLPLL